VSQVLNALTIDVEDYFQVSAFEGHVARHDWHHCESRVVENTRRLLHLLDERNVRATFFVLGWVAERFPQLVRDIHATGHEIGSHSYWHRLVYELTPDEFRSDLQKSRDVLEQIIGEPINAYRAPSFSITKNSFWALEILADEGFTIDSSIFPIYHDRYGIPDAQPGLHQIDTASGDLWEFPPAVVRKARLNIPVSGGGYFRLYPLPFTIRSLRSINQQLARPFVFYVHPWEIDPEQPRLRAGSWLARRRHYVNLRTTESKLRRLLASFRFGCLRDCIKQAQTEAAESSAVSALSSSSSTPIC
jgi:polysaccharide deacetylase family protein (PEP-CTERM system associated)